MDIKKDLSLFGLNEQEQQVFLALSQRGWSTVMQLAKSYPIKRTTLYRIIESLINKGLVIIQVGEKTTFYNIASSDSFETLALEAEEKTNQMRESIKRIKDATQRLSNLKLTETTLVYYKGIRGLKQMEWNVRAGTPNIEWQIFDSGQWAQVVGTNFAETMRQECVEKNIRVRGISNSEHPINPDGTTTWTSNKKYTTKYYRHRLISQKILDIKQDFIIMPDSLVFWGVKSGDEVAIQIKNSDYSVMVCQLFEFMWDKAKVIDKFGDRFK